MKMTIDGIEVPCRTGMTILEAAESAGIPIPTLCHMRGLLPIGGCRICVVEVEGSTRLIGACHTPVTKGMAVKTRSPRVQKVRKTIVELMLAGHTGPCVSDERIGQCELNSLASDLEAGPPRFRARKERCYPVEDQSPYITRDLTRCIRCGRCVKACSEIVGQDVYGAGYRGFGTKIIVDCDVALAKDVCRDCGVCAEYCPTSALTIPGMRPQKKRAREAIAEARPAPARERHDGLLPILRDRQQASGYLSDDFLMETAKSLQMPLSEVYGVASFYAFLSRKPQGRNFIRVCGSIPCYLKGSQRIIETIRKEIGIGPGETSPDKRFSLELTNCIGACDAAPAALVNDDVHGGLTPEKIAGVLKGYR
ncbi:MAG: NADH-quinone oxidoreductase subunit NuoE [Thermodesulfobacteriota bacterium]